MKKIVYLLFVFIVNTSIAQNIVKEKFVSESYHFSNGRIFNIDEKLFVVLSFNGYEDDSIHGYKHHFVIKQYDIEKNKFVSVFDSKNNYYHSYLSDIIIFKNHFIIKTSSQINKQTNKQDSKILVINLQGEIVKEKYISSFGGLLANINNKDVFLFADETKNEYLFDLELNEHKKDADAPYINKFFLEGDQFSLNSADVYSTYSFPKNVMIKDIDSVLFKNNIGGCYSGNVIKLDIDTKTSYLLGCQFDSNYQNDIINLFQKTGKNVKKVSTYSLGAKGHHWVYDAILFKGKIFAIFSSSDEDTKKKLGFNDIDQFMWFVVIDID